MPFPGMGGVEVVVEPTASGSWVVRKNGDHVSRHTYKDAAVSKARKKARKEGGELTVFGQNMQVTESRSYD